VSNNQIARKKNWRNSETTHILSIDVGYAADYEHFAIPIARLREWCVAHIVVAWRWRRIDANDRRPRERRYGE